MVWGWGEIVLSSTDDNDQATLTILLLCPVLEDKDQATLTILLLCPVLNDKDQATITILLLCPVLAGNDQAAGCGAHHHHRLVRHEKPGTSTSFCFTRMVFVMVWLVIRMLVRLQLKLSGSS